MRNCVYFVVFICIGLMVINCAKKKKKKKKKPDQARGFLNIYEPLLHYVRDNETFPIYPDPDENYSEYIYGNCTAELAPTTLYYCNETVTHQQLRRKAIYRRWMNIHHIPNCIILTGRSPEEEVFRAPAFNFQICVARMTIIYMRRAYRYYYFEWFIPNNLAGKMDWVLHFFGPHDRDWLVDPMQSENKTDGN